eukprot:scaffold20432_cov108-Cylindrotheca_fusiformis.AAC.1
MGILGNRAIKTDHHIPIGTLVRDGLPSSFRLGKLDCPLRHLNLSPWAEVSGIVPVAFPTTFHVIATFGECALRWFLMLGIEHCPRNTVARVDLVLMCLDLELPPLDLEHVVWISRLSRFGQSGETKIVGRECISEFSRLGIDIHEVLGNHLGGVCEEGFTGQVRFNVVHMTVECLDSSLKRAVSTSVAAVASAVLVSAATAPISRSLTGFQRGRRCATSSSVFSHLGKGSEQQRKGKYNFSLQ